MAALTPDPIYDTNVLIEVVPTLKVAQNWLLDRYFPNVVTSETEFVSIDVEVGLRRMSPFVSPLVEGKLVEQRRMQTNVFKPPYIKDKRAPDLLRPIRRMIGERIGGGQMTAGDRRMANIMYEMADQVDMLNRRLEWMAAQALISGTVLVVGDGFLNTLVDFGRSSALTIALSGALMWDSGSGSATPVLNITDWAGIVMKNSGAVPTDIIFTTTPWYWFTRDQAVRDAIWFPRGGDANIQLGATPALGAAYMGRWGSYDLWLYNDWYIDDSNVEQRMIPDGTIILTGQQMMGTRAFASIIDPKFNYAALPYAPKTWDVEDPAQTFVMMQSAPIVIPARVNAALAATVTAASAP